MIGRISLCFSPSLCFCFLLLFLDKSYANKVPEPLTLQFALAQAPHALVVAGSQADLQLAIAGREVIDSISDFKLSVNGRLQWIDPPSHVSNQDHDDHKISLNFEKLLYDFGRTDKLMDVSTSNVNSKSLAFRNRVYKQRIKIMRRYFDVLLADLAFDAENEAMAIAFIRADRLLKRSEYGEVTELEVLEAESNNQQVLFKRTTAELQQRSTRALLAEALNLPEHLPEELLEPELSEIDRDIPDYTDLLEQAMQNNMHLKASEMRLQSARSKLSLFQSSNYSKLKAYGEIADYSRERSSADRWRIGLKVTIPLLQSGIINAGQAQERARIAKIESEHAILKAEIRQMVLEQWQKLQSLDQKIKYTEAELDARDVYLDKSRALYQLDLASDLGDAMSRFSRARLEHARARFGLSIAWAQLDHLTGVAQKESQLFSITTGEIPK